MKNYYIGADIGGTTAKLCLYGIEGSNEGIECKWSVPTAGGSTPEVLFGNLVESIKDKCDEYNINMKELAGIGIGIPGPVNEGGEVLGCANLGFGIVNVKKIMAEITGVDNIEVGNDANVAALGEMWKGGAAGYKDVLMITLGTGVGGGLVIDGRIHVGSKGAAAEIGHITVEPDETDICGCGCHGCLEQFASATGVVRMTLKGIESHPESVLAGKKDEASDTDMNMYNITAKDVFDAAKAGDAYALEIVDRFAKYLGIALSNVANVCDPQVFLIGGGVSAAGSVITDNVRKYYEQYSMKALKDRDIKLATLGNDAGILGCIKMTMK